MGLKIKNNIGNKLLVQMIIVVMIIAAGFYSIISMQTKELEKRIFDKAKLFSTILGVHLDRIISDNISAYNSLQMIVKGIAKTHESVEDIRIIAPEFIVLASSSPEYVWQAVDSEYVEVIKDVAANMKPRSLLKTELGKDLVIHFMPLLSLDKEKRLIGVMQIAARFPSQQAQTMAYLRSNKSVYYKEEAAGFAQQVSKDLKSALDEVDKNFRYLDALLASMLKDDEIQDVKLFSHDLRLLGSGSSGRKTPFISQREIALYEKAVLGEETLNLKTPGKNEQRELVSPLYLTQNNNREIIGAVGITVSLIRINALVEARRKNILVMSLVIIAAFCLLIGVFFRKTVMLPIDKLMAMTQRIGKGNFSQKVVINSNDEIGSLAQALNQMSDELFKSKQEIERWNLTLKDRVVEVTKELQQKQAQLMESERMASLGVLSSGIAHEINNPLGIILGHAQMLLKELNTKGNIQNAQEAAVLLKTIEEYTKRCSYIVNSLLEFSRKKELQFQSVSVTAAIENALMFTSSRLGQKGINVTKEYSKNMPQISADSIHLEQVFINIILNAEQSMSGGGQLKVTADMKKNDILISFCDTGQGIAEDDLKKIFDPFFTTRQPGEGSGLGLAISYGIIKAHSGDIIVESKKGQGTKVMVKLPIKK
ncbi:MAG: ATP-binding protein [Candidatus Omnitrophota bacterium]